MATIDPKKTKCAIGALEVALERCERLAPR